MSDGGNEQIKLSDTQILYNKNLIFVYNNKELFSSRKV